MVFYQPTLEEAFPEAFPEQPTKRNTEENEANFSYTLAAHRIDGYDEPLTEDEKAAVSAFLATYRKIKQDKKD